MDLIHFLKTIYPRIKILVFNIACILLLMTYELKGAPSQDLIFQSIKIDTSIYKNYYWSGKKMEIIYGYYKIIPDKPIGLLVLLPGFGRLSKDIFEETKIAQLATQSHFAVIAPAINQSYGWDTTAFRIINECIKHCSISNKIPINNIIIGGLSAGGGLSLMFAIESIKNNALIKPAKVFAVDSPVDMAQLHYTMVRTVESNCNSLYVNEAKWIIAEDLKKYGGNPKEAPEGYAIDSPYCRDCKDGGNARFLLSFPINLYTEPDIQWNLETRCADYYDMNAFGLSGLTRYLRIAGNKHVNLITSQNRGFDKSGIKNPHSWSIIDAADFSKWITKTF
jgi:hypothetical protein